MGVTTLEIMSSPWIKNADSSARPDPIELPDRVDVIVVGGGLAGIGVAVNLARAGTDVALLEARTQLGCGWTGRNLGLVSLGLGEHPARLASAMGRTAAVALLRFSKKNLDLFAHQECAVPNGGIYLPSAPGEVAQIDLGLDILQECGAQPEIWSPQKIEETLGIHSAGPGRFIPEELACDPVAVVESLTKEAIQEGARIHTGCRVESVEDIQDGVRAHFGERAIEAEAIVFANNAGLPLLDPAFSEIIAPARRQSVMVRGSGHPASTPIRSQHGHLEVRILPSGNIMASGCRWATPHMEVGETDETVQIDLVEEKLLEAIERLIQPSSGLEVLSRWSGIMALTCDGLPLVGPVPGGSRRVVCAGFNGQELGFALQAAREVSTGLLGLSNEPLLECLHPARFL